MVLARRGMAVAILDREPAGLAAKRLEAEGARVSVRRAYVTDEAGVRAAVAEAVAVHGCIDLLVNNAGVVGERTGLDNTQPADWELCFRVNLLGAWIVSRACIDLFRAQGGDEIANIARWFDRALRREAGDLCRLRRPELDRQLV